MFVSGLVFWVDILYYKNVVFCGWWVCLVCLRSFKIVMIYLFWIKGLRVIVCGGILEIFFLFGISYDVIIRIFIDIILIRNL